MDSHSLVIAYYCFAIWQCTLYLALQRALWWLCNQRPRCRERQTGKDISNEISGNNNRHLVPSARLYINSEFLQVPSRVCPGKVRRQNVPKSALLEDDHLGQAKSQYIETGVHDYLPRAFATSVKKVARAYSITISYRVQPRKDFRFTLTVTENEILNLKKSQGWALLDLPHLSVVRELDNIRILDSKGNSESLSYPCKGERFEAACSQTGNFVVAWRSDCGGTESAWRLKKPGLSVGDSEGILGQENFNKTVKRRIETHHDEEATPPMKKATRRSQAYKGKKENA